uniref:G-protein coupled receptors family 1 profile domain-containing protein n=1 Tax=Ditylenchus dipsaci TaxID=166011 RepID=A0A915D3N4_9BILA
MEGEILPSSSVEHPPISLISSASATQLLYNMQEPTYSSLATTSSSSIVEVANLPPAQQDDEFCSNSHIVSTETIISFTETTDAILFICTVLSSFLQVYVMYLAIKHIRRRTSDKCMHVFLFSMTFADFLLTALCYPVELAPRAGLISVFPKYISATMHGLCWVGLIVSSLSLVFLNLDKLFYFRFPLRYANFFTRARAIGLVSASWILSSAFVIFAWTTNSFHCVDEDCVTLAIFPNRLYIYVPFMIFVGVIPQSHP